MGILDNKTRVTDTILTQHGRKHLAHGGVQIAYVTFTDGDVFYTPDLASGSVDPTSRFYLEASCLPQDSITFEADDSGRLVPFTPSTGTLERGYVLSPGQILSGSDVDGYDLVSSQVFASQSDVLLESSLQNFKNLYVLGSKDPLFDDPSDRFKLSRTEVLFSVDESVLDDPKRQFVNVNEHESIFNDSKFSRIPNFKFLPPLRSVPPKSTSRPSTSTTSYVNSSLDRYRHKGVQRSTIDDFSKKKSSFTSVEDVPSECFLGVYEPLGSIRVLTDEAVESGLLHFEKMGLRTDIEFESQTLSSQLFCQVFERKTGSLLKLDVLPFGRIRMSGNSGDVYFVGKVVTDENHTNVFIHLFTMVFESGTVESKRIKTRISD